MEKFIHLTGGPARDDGAEVSALSGARSGCRFPSDGQVRTGGATSASEKKRAEDAECTQTFGDVMRYLKPGGEGGEGKGMVYKFPSIFAFLRHRRDVYLSPQKWMKRSFIHHAKYDDMRARWVQPATSRPAVLTDRSFGRFHFHSYLGKCPLRGMILHLHLHTSLQVLAGPLLLRARSYT